MRPDPRITVNDRSLAVTAGKEIFVGSAFAFLGRKAFSTRGLAWVASLLGRESVRPVTISLLGPDPVELPGASIQPLDVPALRLATVTSDKALYRQGRDVVRLLALDPLAPASEAVLELRTGGSEFTRHPVRLDERGAATAALVDLPTGDYEVRFRGAPEEEPGCSFTVADYRLAPLVAGMVERRLEGEPPRLRVTIRLETFGVPVDGAVRLELTERGRRVSEVRADARGGLVEAAFALEGEGPHAVNVQLVDDAARTATVPIVGSRAADRARTTFSTLGTEVFGSLLPSEGAHPVRGIYLEEAGQRASPFRLERIDTRTARLIAGVAVESVRVVVIDATCPVAPAAAAARARTFDPGTKDDRFDDFRHMADDDVLASLRGSGPFEALLTMGRREISVEAVPAGGTVEIACPGPVSLLAVGGFADGAPWEGWAAVLAPEELAPRVQVPERCDPGGEIAVEVETGRRCDAAVYLVLKDARLSTVDTPMSRLAGQVKAQVEACGKRLAVGPATTSLAAAIPPPPPEIPRPLMTGMPFGGAIPGSAPTMERMTGAYRTGAPLVDDDVTRDSIGHCPAYGSGYAPEGAAVEAGPAAPRAAATTDEPEVLFAGLLTATGGLARAVVRLGPGFADYVAEAFVFAGLDWAEARTRFRAAKAPFVSLDLSPFCHAEDTVVGRVHVGSSEGSSFRVRVARDGVQIPILLDGRPVTATEEIAAGRAELAFLAGPGEYVATVEEVATGAVDRVVKRVDPPGRLRRLARTLCLLEPGERIARESDATIVSLAVLPGLEAPFRALIDATADYGHACCEQTAAKMLAACSMYTLAGDDGDRRARAEAIIIAGVRREASMWLRGRGFKMYPECVDEPHPYYGPKAARYLRNLALLRSGRGSAGAGGRTGPGAALERAIDEGLAMAEDASGAYRLQWPPTDTATCEEAYAVVRFGADGASRERGLARARGHAALVAAGRPLDQTASSPYLSGAVAMRAESSFAAAALLRCGGAADRRAALALANSVVKDLGDEGRLYSTVDSVAAIALMSELRAARIVVGAGAGTVDVDGRRLSITEATELTGGIRAIAAVEGVAAVEVVRLKEEDWAALASSAPVLVTVEKGGRAMRRFVVGDALDLRVKLERGHKDGDLVWVCLPDALSRVVGGGQVKRFSVDFEGRDEVVVPLAATSATVNRQGETAPQRFAACVRNMFEEERAGNPGPVDVTVAPSSNDSGSALRRALDTFRRLLVRG
ncbi:MAG: hypothetical protein HY815_01110 [Candidatus Riflebacteria bacterium]|nr:hypothetical protein [Candidatus Riflebacteria bacterium]